MRNLQVHFDVRLLATNATGDRLFPDHQCFDGPPPVLQVTYLYSLN